MKHIKLFLIIYTFSIAVGANTNPILLDYFEKIYYFLNEAFGE